MGKRGERKRSGVEGIEGKKKERVKRKGMRDSGGERGGGGEGRGGEEDTCFCDVPIWMTYVIMGAGHGLGT